MLKRRGLLLGVAGFTLVLLGMGTGVLGSLWLRTRVPGVPPASSSVTVVRPTGNVLARVRDLERLESVTFHMERVIDLTEKQSRLFGLVETEDALLLVAAAEVRAGIDLSKLRAEDVEVDVSAGRARVVLPPAEVFGSALDGNRTYVHTRRTGVLASRRENLETRARQEAERALSEAALEVGILARAEQNAERTVSELVRSLGYRDVDVSVRR